MRMALWFFAVGTTHNKKLYSKPVTGDRGTPPEFMLFNF